MGMEARVEGSSGGGIGLILIVPLTSLRSAFGFLDPHPPPPPRLPAETFARAFSWEQLPGRSRQVHKVQNPREDIRHNREPLISSPAGRSGRSNAEGSNCLSADAFKCTKPNYERTCCPLQFHEYYRALLLLPFSSRSLIKQKKRERGLTHCRLN